MRLRWPPPLSLLLVLVAMLAGCQPRDPDTLMQAARQHQARGDIKAAVIELKNVVQHDRNHRAARLLLGELHLEQGDAAAAEKELRRALALGAERGAATLKLTNALLAQGKFGPALAETGDERVTQAAPSLRPALLAARASALAGLGRTDAARAALHHAAQLAPTAPEPPLGLARIAMSERRPDLARQLVQQALAANPGHIDSLRLQADLLRAEEKPQAALACQMAILKQRPHDVQALVEVAGLHADAGRLGDARATLGAARRVGASSLAMELAQALIAYRENKPAAALEKVQRVLAADPTYAPALLLAGTLHGHLGAHELATGHLRAFLAQHPGHPYASKRLAAAHLQQQRPAQALALLEPLIAQHPADVDLLSLTGEAHLRQRQFGTAADLFERARTLRPGDAGLHAGVAISHLGSGRHTLALSGLERAVGLEGGLGRFGALLVMSYLERGLPEQAMQTVDAMERQARTPLVHQLRGAIQLARQQPGQARASFEQALALDPIHLPALASLAQLDLIEHRGGAATDRYLAALARAPRNGALMEALAGLSLASQRPADAIRWMDRAVAAQSSTGQLPPLPLALRAGALYVKAGQPRRAHELATRLHAAHPADPGVLQLLARAARASGQPARALDAYARLQALAPDSALPWLEQAQVYLAQDQQDAALTGLHKALAIAPGLAQARILQVNLLLRRGAFDKARAAALAARQHAPGAAIGDKLLGDVAAAEGRHGAALQAYERAFALAPSGAAVVQIANALSAQGRQRASDERIEAWLQAHPRDVATRLHYASSQLMRHAHASAIVHYEAVLQTEPRNVAALNDLAWCYQLTGSRKALDTGLRAYRLAPGNPAVMDTLGWIYLQQGQTAHALPLLRRASLLAPGAAQIHYHYGTALAQAGDRAGARRVLQTTLREHAAFDGREQASALLARL